MSHAALPTLYASLPDCPRGRAAAIYPSPRTTPLAPGEICKARGVLGESHGVADEEANDCASGVDRLVAVLVQIAPPLLASMAALRVRLHVSSMKPCLKRGVNVQLSLRGRLAPTRTSNVLPRSPAHLRMPCSHGISLGFTSQPPSTTSKYVRASSNAKLLGKQ